MEDILKHVTQLLFSMLSQIKIVRCLCSKVIKKICCSFLFQFFLFPAEAPPLIKEEKEIFLTKPNHIAIIMDGNGRWGQAKYGNRSAGHIHAKKAVKEVIQECLVQGIPYLTMYAFSTENWGRPKLEIDEIFRIITDGVCENLPSFLENNIHFQVIGDLQGIPEECCNALNKCIEATKHNTKLHLTAAINYGGQMEAVTASKAIAKDFLHDALHEFQKQFSHALSFKNFIQFLDSYHPKVSLEGYPKYLYTHSLPPVDLIIRTGGRKRLSNFLLWQSAYAEIYFMDLLWPNFRKNHLIEALLFFQQQCRTFGAA